MLAPSAAHLECIAIESSKKAVIVDDAIGDRMAGRIRDSCYIWAEKLEKRGKLRRQDRQEVSEDWSRMVGQERKEKK